MVQSVYFPFNIEGNFNNNVTAGNSIILIPALYSSANSRAFTSSNPQFGSKGNTVPGTLLVEGTGPICARRPGYGYTGLWLLPDVAGGGTFVRVNCYLPVPRRSARHVRLRGRRTRRRTAARPGWRRVVGGRHRHQG